MSKSLQQLAERSNRGSLLANATWWGDSNPSLEQMAQLIKIIRCVKTELKIDIGTQATRTIMMEAGYRPLSLSQSLGPHCKTIRAT